MKEDMETKSSELDASNEIALKILLVGAPKSGKTSLVRRLCDKPFREDYLPTLGFDGAVVPYGTYQGRPVMLHLWDVAGSQLNAQPCHHGLFGDGADGVMYVMDVTSRESLQAVDDWDRALSRYLPPWRCKFLVGHKADLPVYVVNDEALSLYVASASGFCGWCLTVGSSEYGDYDVAARRGGGGATADAGGRHKGQSLSGEKQLSVSEAMRTLMGHIFRAGGARGASARPAGVLGLGASTGGATPLPSENLDKALETMELLGLGVRKQKALKNQAKESGFLTASDSGCGIVDSGDGDSGSGDAIGPFGGMQDLLERGCVPDFSRWRREGSMREGSSVGVDGDEQGRADIGSADPGWQHFAGRMGREQAEALLGGQPDGTFFLRRKGPSVLVLTYVAKKKNSGGRKISNSPRRPKASASPGNKKNAGKGVSIGGVSGEADGRGRGADRSTSVQHALLVYEDGFFSDEKGRLGRFSTIDELLKSKIKALARFPLSFRREKGRYVLIDPEAQATDQDQNPTPPTDHNQQQQSSTTNPRVLNPFAWEKENGNDEKTGVIAAAPPPSSATPASSSIPDNVFGDQAQLRVATAIASHPSPPIPPPPPLSFSSSTPPPRVTPGASALYEGGVRSRLPRAGSRRGSPTGGNGGDWIDSRIIANSGIASKTRKPVGGGAVSGGSLWMEAAAAAAEKSSTAGTKNSERGSPKNTTGSVHSVSAGGARRRAMKGSGSSVDEDGGASVSPWSVTELADADHRGHHHHQQQQQQRSGEQSAMAVAAEVAAAATVAKSHPDAKRVEKQTLQAESAVNDAVAMLERQVRPLIVRRTSRQPSPAATEPHTHRSPTSSNYSSPRDSRSPSLSRFAVVEEQPPQQWVPAAPEGAPAAPLAGAAALLMERAWSCRQDLVESGHKLRERALALAVSEGNKAGLANSITNTVSPPGGAVNDTQGVMPLASLPAHAPAAQRFFSSRELFPVFDDAKARLEGQKASSYDYPGGMLEDEVQESAVVGQPANGNGGLLGAFSCGDFERILGDEQLTAGSLELPQGDIERDVCNTLLRVDSGQAGPTSDTSTTVQRSFSGFELSALPSAPRVGDGGLASRTQRQGESQVKEDIDPPPDAWGALFRDVGIAEGRCREFLAVWEVAGNALGDACEEGFGSMAQ